MPKYILGSGIVGLLAKEIYGEEYDIIPHGASRFYSYNPALADNYISASDKIDKKLISAPNEALFTRAFSLGGLLNFSSHQWLYDLYTSKVYGDGYTYFSAVTPMLFRISTIPVNELYKSLLIKYKDLLIKKSQEYGRLEKISNGILHTTKKSLGYDRIISTIPLNAILEAASYPSELPSKDVWIYHIRSDKINLEGADQVFVIDEVLDFYKVNRISQNEYTFFCLKEIVTPLEYFGLFTNNKLELLNTTKINKYIPLQSDAPLKAIKDLNIKCVGSYAEWDDTVDVGACIVRLLKNV